MCIFPPLSNTVYEPGGVMWRMSSGMDVEIERAEWMWRISDEDIYLRLAKKYFYVFLFFIDIMYKHEPDWVERMWAEQCGE